MQKIDTAISLRKFLREIDIYKKGAAFQMQRGIFLLQAEFPNAILSFSAPKLLPPPIVFAVRINFNNYDFEPPSVVFIDPFTHQILPLAPVPMQRKVGGTPEQPQLHQLVQKDDTGLPFICIPGIREYHNHPAHTGDQWLRYRGESGIGTLGFIVDQLYAYGIAGLHAYSLNINIPRVGITYDAKLIPE